MLKKIKWFWQESLKYTGYGKFEIIKKGFVPKCITYLFESRNDPLK
jgi:hypothetical protein